MEIIDPLTFGRHEEIWSPIPEWDQYYAASTWGRVKRFHRKVPYKDGRPFFIPEKVLSQNVDSSLYLNVTLQVNYKKGLSLVHQIIAKTFLENPDKLKEINHIDANKQNNFLYNLEYSTRKGNMQHAYENSPGLIKLKKPVVQKDKLGNEIARFSSLNEAARANNTSMQGISGVCSGKYKYHLGFVYEFIK